MLDKILNTRVFMFCIDLKEVHSEVQTSTEPDSSNIWIYIDDAHKQNQAASRWSGSAMSNL